MAVRYAHLSRPQRYDPSGSAGRRDNDARLKDLFGNPSSVHYYGQQAKAALDDARSAVAALVGAEPSEIVFTSSGTEADNLAIRGAAEALEPSGRRHLVTSGIEHEAVLNTFKALARARLENHAAADGRLRDSGAGSPPGGADRRHGARFRDARQQRNRHHSAGGGAGRHRARARGAFHTDAVQSTGKIPVNVRTLGVDLLALSAHKFYGPKGAGALWIKRGVRLLPFATGGKQERNRRGRH
jgi:cysteine desulfurase